MPNIPTYEAPQLALQPSEAGIDALQQAARRTGAFYDQAAQDKMQTGARLGAATKDLGDAAVQMAEHDDIKRKSVEFANLQDDLTQKWNATVKDADPNDPTVAQKFREGVLEPELEKLSDGTLTQGGSNWAQSHAMALRQHFFEKTAADMSTLAGIGAQESFATTGNKLASTARTDPSSLDFQLKMADTSLGAIADSSPTLTPADRARLKAEGVLKIKENIVKSAVIGMIENNPNVDLSKIEEKYGDYITGPEMQLFQKSAKVQARADLAMQRQSELLKRQIGDQNVHEQMNKNFSDNVSIDPQTGRPIIKPEFFQRSLDIAKNNPDAPIASTAARTLLDWGEHQQNLKENVVDDPTTRQFNIDHMFDPDKPTTELKIMRDEVEGKLSRTTAAVQIQLVKQLSEQPLKGPIWQDAMKAAQAELVLSGVGLPGKDIAGEANYAKFVQNFIPQYLAAVRGGNVPPNALDVKDPNSMISQAMAPFKRTVTQRMNDYSASLGGVVTGVSAPENKPIALPSVTDRKAGQTYPTPSGPKKWTGTGWVNP